MTADGRISMAGLNAGNIESVPPPPPPPLSLSRAPCMADWLSFLGFACSYFADSVSKAVKGEL